MEEELLKLEGEMAKPDFWSKPQEEILRITQKRSRILDQIKDWTHLNKGLEDAKTLAELALEEHDITALKEAGELLRDLKKQLKAFTLKTVMQEPEDRLDAIVAINAGTGGTDAQDWCQILFRMYTRWAERHHMGVEVRDILEGEEAGIKNVTFSVLGSYAYGFLKTEHGIHRLVRISPFDASGRRHTSFASVSVYPDVGDDIVVEIDEKDIRIDTYRASGPGGQHVNKTSSAVRITHLPTGIVVQCQNEKSQHRNKDMAMKILKARLYELEKKKKEAKKQEIHQSQKEISWGNQIRSYVFNPYRLVKDHRTNVEVGNVDAVLDGEIDEFIEAYLNLNKNKPSETLEARTA